MSTKSDHRNRKWNYVPFILLALFPACLRTLSLRADEQRLMEALLPGYNTAARPVYNAAQIVTVKFGLTLIQISDMDEVNQVLTINVWLEQEWQDERLVWDPSLYNGLKILRIPCEKIWLPDIVLYNSADDFTTGYMKSKAMVTSSGNVFWPPPAKFRSSCKIDITYFPFDDQVCELKFGSWTYDGFQVDITNRSAQVDLTNYVFSGEWELIDVKVRRTEMYYACCEEPYPDVRFTIIIRRKTLYYLFNIIFPCLWLTILSLLGFWLPPDSGEKITLGITVLLAFSVFMLLIAESMPATSEFVPLIGIYLTVTMAMTSLSIILTVFVLQLHHVGPHQKRVPRWVWTLVVDILAPLVCLCHISHRYRYLSAKLKAKAPDANHHNHASNAMPNLTHPLKTLNGHHIGGNERKGAAVNSSTDFVSAFGGEGRDAQACNGTVISKRGSAAAQTVSVPNHVQNNRHEDEGRGQYSYGQDRLRLEEGFAKFREPAVAVAAVSSPQSPLAPLAPMYHLQNYDGTHLTSSGEIRGSVTPNIWQISEESVIICGQGNGASTTSRPVQCVPGGFTRSGNGAVHGDLEGRLGAGESVGPESSSNHIRRAHIHQVTGDNPQDPNQKLAVLCTRQTCLHPSKTNSCPEMVYLQSELNPVQSAHYVQENGPASCQSVRAKQQEDPKYEDGISRDTSGKHFRTTSDISEGDSKTFPGVSGDTFHTVCKVNIGDVIPVLPVSRSKCSFADRRDSGKEEAVQPVETISQTDKTDDHQDVVTEWRVVAHVMDRLLFWFFLLISFISSVLILVVKPINKPEEWRNG